MTDKEDRIAKLSQRFKTHSAGRPRSDSKNRERQSLYLDTNLTGRIDRTYKDLAHALYPRSISKSTFLETILEYGLENLEDVKSRLSEIAEASELSENP
jgi:hypothetical protein